MTLAESAFEVLRPAFAKALGKSLDDVTATTRVANVVPRPIRWQVWREVESHLGIELPRLQFSFLQMCGVALLAAGLWLIAAGIVVCFDAPSRLWLIHLALLGLIAFIPLSVWLSARLLAERADALPGLPLMLDLAHATVRQNMRVFRTRYGVKPSRDEIFEIVRVVLVDTLGVDECEVTPEARLVEDLGA